LYHFIYDTWTYATHNFWSFASSTCIYRATYVKLAFIGDVTESLYFVIFNYFKFCVEYNVRFLQPQERRKLSTLLFDNLKMNSLVSCRIDGCEMMV